MQNAPHEHSAILLTCIKQCFENLFLYSFECSFKTGFTALHFEQQRLRKGVQWLSGRVLDLRPRGRRFEPHRRHCIVSLSKTL